MKTTLTILIAIFLMSGSCRKELAPDEELTLQKQNYNDTTLRIDGYYYFKEGNNLYNSYIFYSNGVILSGGGSAPNSDPFIYIENLFNSYQSNFSYKEHKADWGLFNIKDSIIILERWYPSTGGGLPVGKMIGKITNDTTFIINNSMNEKNTINETYHFRKYSPKPDSTNSFIN